MDVTPDADLLLVVEEVSKTFSTRQRGRMPRHVVRALSQVSFTVRARETLVIIGESGSGKSTLARLLVNLVRPDRGRVRWMGQDLTALHGEKSRLLRRDLQLVLQDRRGALNPRLNIGELVAEPLRVLRPELDRTERYRRVEEMLSAVGLPAAVAARLPDELSDGEAQRAGIARALIVGPQLLVCDEPFAALDPATQARILNLLNEMKEWLGLTLVIVTNDLSVARHVADRVLVLFQGQVMEVAPGAILDDVPLHPYTRALLAADLPPDPRRAREIEPEWPVPDEGQPAIHPGCAWQPRCAHATALCRAERPPLEPVPPYGEVACHNWRDLLHG